MPRMHNERHRTERIGWLRAAVLGANDGIVSTASLVSASPRRAPPAGRLVAGVAGLVAGAMSMAAGGYVRSSRSPARKRADLARERLELAADPGGRTYELAGMYVKRGLERQAR